MLSDIELFGLLKERNYDAFSLLYDTYAPRLLGLICSLTPDAAMADDILETCFVKIWRDFPTHKLNEAAFSLWMVSMTLMECSKTLNLPKTALTFLLNREIQQNG